MGMNIMQLMQMMNNPQVKALMNSKNPQQMAINMIKNSPNANSEIGKNILSMLEKGDMKGIEQYGKNIVQSQGMDPNQVMSMLSNMR